MRVALALSLYHLQLLVVELRLFLVLLAVWYKVVALRKAVRPVVLHVARVRILPFVQSPVMLLAQPPLAFLAAL